jgi:predicted ATPase/class 3 adenylate cyclase
MTDIEGSTRLWSQFEDVLDDLIARHDALIEEAVAANGGTFVKAKGEGDSTFSVFSGPRDALNAAVAIQLALGSEPWPMEIDLRTRAALHSGETKQRDGDYFGSTVNRCARLRAIAHGGQIVLSQATADLVADELPPKVSLRDLGVHGLRDLSRPERVFQADHPELNTEFGPLRSLGSTRSNLPAQRSAFFGRANELKIVAEHLATARLVTLTGVGGCGKTRLAVEAAALELDRFDSVNFCDLSMTADPEVIAGEVAKAVNVLAAGPLVPSMRNVRGDLLENLRARNLLLVLDNCEHLIDAAADLVDEILGTCPEVRVLATSREALEVDGERAYTVPSLSVPASGDTDSDAVRLFVDRAQAAGADFALDDETAGHIAEICRRLDGIPLAIELAAAQTVALSPEQIEARLSDRFRLLSGGRRRVQRQQTLATMLDWSHDLLSDAERAVLRGLAVFPQPFTLEQAEAVLQSTTPVPVAGALRSLFSKSLITTVDNRYRLLETVRLYAEQKLLEAGEAEEMRTRHCDYVVAWVKSFDADDQVWTAAVGEYFIPELDHIRAAVRWSEQQDDLIAIAAIASRGWLASANSLEETAGWFELAERADLSDADRLRFLTARAWQAVARVDLPTLMASAEQALKLPRDESGLCHAVCHAFVGLAHATMHHLFGGGDEAVARQHIDEALGSTASNHAEALTCLWAALAQVGLHDLEGARATLHRSTAVKRDPDTATGAAYTVLSLVETLRGDDDAALAAMENSVALFASDAWGIATEYDRFWTAAYGPALFIVGRKTEAIAFMQDLVAHFAPTGAPAQMVPVILGCLGAMVAVSERYEEAVLLLVNAVERPISAIDHMAFSRYMDQAKETMAAERYEELCAEGRTLGLADGAARAFAVLDTLA